jgi:putative flippase GtrA
MRGGGRCLIKSGVDTLLIAKFTRAPLFRFLLVGGAGFVVDAGIVWALTHMGFGAYLARFVSLSVTVVFTFFLNRTATFLAQGPMTWQEFVAYAGSSGVGIAINYALFAGCLRLGLSWLPAMIVGTGTASAFNFLAYSRIFKKSAS